MQRTSCEKPKALERLWRMRCHAKRKRLRSTEVSHNVSEEDILKVDPPPQEVPTDTTWIRDGLPSQALCEF